MTDRQDRLGEQYVAAGKQLDLARQTVLEKSALRLSELLQLDPKIRVEHTNDPALTRRDRQRVVRSLVEPPTPRNAPVRRNRRSLMPWSRFAKLMLILVPVMALLIVAKANTPLSLRLLQPVTLDWTLPQGGSEQTTLQPGDVLAYFVHGDGTTTARRWVSGRGYATAQFAFE